MEKVGKFYHIVLPKVLEILNQVGGGVVIAKLNVPYYKYTGFNYCYSDDHSYPEFGFGIYKLSTMDRYFYIDYRDYNYGNYHYSGGHDADIWIKYDFDEMELYLRNNSP